MIRKYQVIIIMLISFFISACVPIAHISKFPAFPVNIFPENFSKYNEDILIIPIWERAPFFAYEGGPQSGGIFLGEHIILSTQKRDEIPNKIPGKISLGLITLPAFMGRWVELQKIYIISKSGQAISLTATGTFPRSIPNWGTIRHAYLGQKWINELIDTFAVTEEINFKSPEKIEASFWALACDFCREGSPKIAVGYFPKERQKIIEFLREIPLNAKTDNQNQWKTIYHKTH